MKIYGYELTAITESTNELTTILYRRNCRNKQIIDSERKCVKLDRIKVTYNGMEICKFDRTKEDLQEMVNSILDWAYEDGTIGSHARKKVNNEILTAVLAEYAI